MSSELLVTEFTTVRHWFHNSTPLSSQQPATDFTTARHSYPS